MAMQLPIRCQSVALVVLRGAGDETQTLVMKRATKILPGAWCQVAGCIEDGEAAWQTAVRELREETGLAPSEFRSAGVCEQFYDAATNCVWIVPAFVAWVAAGANVTLNWEHNEFRWVSFDEADRMLATPNQRELFVHVRRHFVERPPNEWTRIDAGTP